MFVWTNLSINLYRSVVNPIFFYIKSIVFFVLLPMDKLDASFELCPLPMSAFCAITLCMTNIDT